VNSGHETSRWVISLHPKHIAVLREQGFRNLYFAAAKNPLSWASSPHESYLGLRLKPMRSMLSSWIQNFSGVGAELSTVSGFGSLSEEPYGTADCDWYFGTGILSEILEMIGEEDSCLDSNGLY
jgi:hypothetical protein